MQELYQNRFYLLGWKLWIIQNIILLIPLVVCIPVISSDLYRFFVNLELDYYASKALNYIFTFALLIDIIPILIISITSFLNFSAIKDQIDSRRRLFYIPISGILWIFFSLLWRLPFYFIWGFDLGFANEGIWWDLEDNQFYLNLLNNHFVHFCQIVGSFCLFAFLFLQEKLFEPITKLNRKSDIESLGIGRATILGSLNIFSMLCIFFGSNISPYSVNTLELYGSRPNGIIFFVGLLFKMVFIPLLVIFTCIRILSLGKMAKATKTEIYERPLPRIPHVDH